MSQLFAWGGQSIGVSALASVLPKNTQDWSPLGWTGWISLKSKGFSRVFSNTTVQKHKLFGAQCSLWSNSHPYMTIEKTIAWTIWIFVSKVMLLLLNTLSRFVITFLPRSKCLNFMAAVTICRDFGAQENKVCHCFHFFPFYLPQSDGARCHNLSFFLMLSLKPAFSPSFFTFIKRLFSSSSFSAIKVVSSPYLRLLVFLLAILIPVCDSFGLAFRIMYSA